MMSILTLCINLFILIISDTVAVKLIEGEHTIVKKDGATHNISKYYVVPNDYDPNNNNTNSNTIKTSKRRILQTKHSKSMDSGVSNKLQVSEVKAESNKTNENNDIDRNTSMHNNAAIDNTKVYSDQNDIKVTVQAGDYTVETMESVGTEHNLKGTGLTSLLVEPLNKSINISSNVTADIHETDNTSKNQIRSIVEHAKETSEANLDDELDDLIFTNFGIAVHELSAQNIKSFWKLVKLNVEKTSDETELFAKLERLTLLLSIFKNLYQVAQSQKPFECMIDSIIYILQNPCVKKRNTNKSQSEIIVSGRNKKDPHLALNGTNLIELEGRKPSPQMTTSSIELENPDSKETLAGDSNNSYKLRDDRRSNDIKPLSDLDNLKVGTPEGYNVSSTIPSLTLHHVTRDSIQEDSESKQSFSDSSQTDEEQDDLIESKLSTNHPLPNELGVTKQWIVEDKSPESRVEGVVQNKSTESKVTEPWVLEVKSPESRINANQSLLITSSELAGDEPTTELSSADYQPLTTASRTVGDQSTTESSFANYQPVTNSSGILGDQPSTESSLTGYHPATTASGDRALTIAFRSTDNQPLTYVSRMAEDQSLSTESDISEAQRLATESKFTNDQSLTTVESRLVSNHPLTTVSVMTGDQPLSAESRLTEDPRSTPESRSVSDHPLPTVSGMPEDKPFLTELRITDNQPLTTESRLTRDLPLTNVSGMAQNQPLSAELKLSDDKPLTPESRLVSDHQLTTVSGMTEDLPLSTESDLSDDQLSTTESGIAEDQSLSTEARLVSDHPLTTVSGMPEDKPLSTESILVSDHPFTTVSGILENNPLTTELKNTDNEPLTAESRLVNGHSLSTESRIPDDQPLITELEMDENLPLATDSRVTKLLIPEDKWTENVPSTFPGLRIGGPQQTEDQITNNLPWHIKYKTTHELPWHIEDRNLDKLPWYIEDRNSDKLAWHIEDRPSDKLPWYIEDRTPELRLPWTIIHKTTPIPWIIEDRSNKNVRWNVEYNKIGQSPTKLYQSSGPDISTYNGKILLDPKQPSIVNRVKHTVTEPYHIYMYVVKPKTTLYEMPTTDEIANVKNEQPNSNLATNSYSLSSSNSSKKALLNYITSDYDKIDVVNPSDLLSDSNQPKHVVGPEIGSSPNPELVLTSEKITNSDEDTDGSQTSQHPIYVSHSELIIPNEYHSPTVAKSEILDQHPELMNMVSYHPKNTNTISVNDEKPQTVDDKYKDHRPELALQSAYTIILDDYDEPTTIIGENAPQHPSFISHATDHAEVSTLNENHNSTANYTQNIDQDLEHINSAENYEYTKPEQPDSDYTEVHTGFGTKIIHQPGYKFALDDDDEPTPVSSENTPQHSGYFSHGSINSEFINVPIDYESANIHQHHDFGPVVPYHPQYSISAENFEESNPVNDEHTDHHPVSAVKLPHQQEYTNVEFTNISKDYNSENIQQQHNFGSVLSLHPEYSNSVEKYEEVKPSDSEYTEEHTGFVPKITHQPGYKFALDDDDEPTPVSGESTPQHPRYVSHGSIHSEFINVPSDYDSANIQHHDFGPMVPYHPEYSNSVEKYEESNPVNDEHTDQHPVSAVKLPHQQEYTNVLDDYDEPTPVSDENKPQNPGHKSHASVHVEFTNIPNDYNSENIQQHHNFGSVLSLHPDYSNSVEKYEQLKPSDSEYTEEHTGFVPKITHQPGYKFSLDDDDAPTPVSGENTPQHLGYISHVSTHSEYTIPNKYHNPTGTSSENMDHPPDFISKVPYESEYTNVLVDNDEPTPVSGKNTPQHPGYVSHGSIHSEFINVPNDYDSANIQQHHDFGPMVPYHPKYSFSAEKYKKPNPVNDEHNDHHPDSAVKLPHQQEYTYVLDDYDEPNPVSGENTPQHSGYISHVSAHTEYTIPNEYHNPTGTSSENMDQSPDFISKVPHESEYTNVRNDYKSANIHQHHDFGPMVPYHPEYSNSAEKSEESNPVNDEHTDHHPVSAVKLPHQKEYTNVVDDYDEPTPVSDENKPQNSGHKSHASVHVEFTNIPNDYNSENIHQPEYTFSLDDDDEPTPVTGENTPQHLGYISHVSAHSEYTIPNEYHNPRGTNSENTNVLNDFDESTPASHENTPQHSDYIYHDSEVTTTNEYNNLKPDNGKHLYTHAVSTQNMLHTPESINIQEEYSKRIPVDNVETVLHPDGDGEDTNTSPSEIQNGLHYLKHIYILNKDITRPTLVDGRHAVHKVQPSFVAYLHSKQPKKINYLKKKKIPQTYQLFTLGNVLQLHDAVIKAIQLSDGDDSDYRALVNLSKIIKLILVVAKQLDEPKGKNEWYKKIFLNADENRHPLQLYVYNLIRQRWLHELMLILLKKNFDSHILQNPRIFYFLGSWKFPSYVQKYLEAEDLIKNVLDDEMLNDFQDRYYYTSKYDGLKNYIKNKVIQNYQVPNDDIVVNIAGIEVEPEAHAIISMLKQYMHYKNIIKNQENVIIRHIKLAMLKKIAVFLKQKGYPRDTISDLIRKLYSAVYLTEGHECQPYHPHFLKNMFDIILPVLRRSGQ